MPKTLFYLGVLSAFLIAVLSALYAVSAWAGGSVGEVDGLALSGKPAAPYFFFCVLAFSIPVGALFVRMASLLAVRNLFEAFLALSALVSTLITVALLAISSLRLSVFAASTQAPEPVVPGALLESHLVNYYALGLFLSLLLLSLRPWFRIQANAVLSGSMMLPSILYAWILVEEHFIAPVATMSAAFRSAPSFAFFIIVSGIFAGLAVHCLLHRHLFVEVTNLREITAGDLAFGG